MIETGSASIKRSDMRSREKIERSGGKMRSNYTFGSSVICGRVVLAPSAVLDTPHGPVSHPAHESSKQLRWLPPMAPRMNGASC